MPRAKLNRPTGNHLLDRLPKSDLDRLLVDAREEMFEPRDRVETLGRDGQSVYFPTSGVYSLLLPTARGKPVEVAVVDSEGMLGIPVVLGMESDPLRAVVQTRGGCIRIPPEQFLEVIRSSEVLDALVRRFLAVSWQTANQTIACNLRHTVKQRVGRCLLSVHDRSETDEFVLTQEILSNMVGASRQKVTMVAGQLQTAGSIRYQRGRIRILDRGSLEASSCECYRILRRAYTFLTS